MVCDLRKNKKAQSVMGEYVLTFVLVVGTLTIVGGYIKRAMSGKIRDSHRFMATQIRDQKFKGKIWLQYEPYYTNQEATRSSAGKTDSQLLPDFGRPGIYTETGIETKDTKSTGTQLPPRDAD